MIQNHVALVLAGSAAHFLTGWALNCELLLGQFWKKDKDKSKSCGLSKDMRINLAAQFATSIALSIATCVAICVFEKYQAPVVSQDAVSKLYSMFFSPAQVGKSYMNAFHTILFIWAGFIVPTSAGEVIWCGHNWKMWMLEMVSELVGLAAIAATIVFLS